MWQSTSVRESPEPEERTLVIDERARSPSSASDSANTESRSTESIRTTEPTPRIIEALAAEPIVVEGVICILTKKDRDSLALCDQCGLWFRNEVKLRQHYLTDHTVSSYHCIICLKRFDTLSKVFRHDQRSHNTQPFQCTSCDKQFKRKYSLTKHMKKKHEGN